MLPTGTGSPWRSQRRIEGHTITKPSGWGNQEWEDLKGELKACHSTASFTLNEPSLEDLKGELKGNIRLAQKAMPKKARRSQRRIEGQFQPREGRPPCRGWVEDLKGELKADSASSETLGSRLRRSQRRIEGHTGSPLSAWESSVLGRSQRRIEGLLIEVVNRYPAGGRSQRRIEGNSLPFSHPNKHLTLNEDLKGELKVNCGAFLYRSNISIAWRSQRRIEGGLGMCWVGTRGLIWLMEKISKENWRNSSLVSMRLIEPLWKKISKENWRHQAPKQLHLSMWLGWEDLKGELKASIIVLSLTMTPLLLRRSQRRIED